MTGYDEYFESGCTLTEKTLVFLEAFNSKRWSFATKSKRLYIHFCIPAYDGGMRLISTSHTRLICHLDNNLDDHEQRMKTQVVVILGLQGNSRAIKIMKKWGLIS